MPKSIAKSKTIWTGLIIAVLALIWPNLDESLSTQIAVLIEAAIFMGLRLVTSRPVSIFEDKDTIHLGG